MNCKKIEYKGVLYERISDKTNIITHLHHDHTGYLDLFKNPEFYVQEKEVMESYYPMGLQVIGYHMGENIRTLHKLDFMADIVIPGHDPLLIDMKVIPDDYYLEDES